MSLGWKVLLPLGLVNIALTASAVVLRAEPVIPFATIAVGVAALLLAQWSSRQPVPAT
jgi:hypothetical protein